MDIPALAKYFQKKYSTTDPRQIAKAEGVLILCEYLGKSTWGYYSNANRIPIIHTHNGLDETSEIFTVAHEFGHHKMHPHTNTPYLKANTFQVIGRIEREANTFAAELLIPDEILLQGYSIFQAAEICGVPEEVAHLKQMPVFKRQLL